MTPELHIIGIDPGGTTGVTRITIPRLSIFGNQAPEIIEWDYFAVNGTEPKQAVEIARYARETQSLAYLVGPALLSEAWDQDPDFKSTDSEPLSPVRINAMLRLLDYQHLLGDSTLNFQPRALAMQFATDERLKKRGLYVDHKDIRAATRHAITGLRRARENPEFASILWPNARLHAGRRTSSASWILNVHSLNHAGKRSWKWMNRRMHYSLFRTQATILEVRPPPGAAERRN